MDATLDSAFAPYAAKMQAAGLPRLAIDCFRYYFEQYRRGESGFLRETEISPVTDVPDVSTLAAHRDAGRRALGRAVVIKLNGGLGTSMGLSAAKSLLPAKAGFSFLDLIVRQILHLRREHECALPLVLMNSFRTRDDSRRVLARYPELEAGIPEDFLQHKVPRIATSDGLPIAWPPDPELEWCPPGHGDVYPALVTSGLLSALRARGIRWAFLSNADNLGACVDLDVLGWVASEQIPFLMEVADRSEADRKGGHVARVADRRLVLRETAQCAPEDVAAFQDVRRHRYFNTNNLWVDLDVLARLLDERHGILGLSLIVNEKPVDPHDPKSPRVIQLETAMGAALGVFPGARALHVPRGRLVPVKTTSDLLALWSDAYDLGDDFRVVASPRRRARDLVIDLDPAYYRSVEDLTLRFPEGAPSLVACHRLVVRGDVRFGAGVLIEGDVTIQQDGSFPRHVPAGTVLRG